jgi:hypothetical protein
VGHELAQGQPSQNLVRPEQSGFWFEQGGVISVLVPGVQYAVERDQTVLVSVDGERQTVVGPKLFELSLEVDRASGFRLYVTEPHAADRRPTEGSRLGGAPAATDRAELEPQRATSVQQAPADLSATTPAPALSGWARAATAMRQGDRATAERELLAIANSGTQQSRDAAELALAELWLAAGTPQRAAPLLLRLRETGATDHIRRRARELLP